MSLTYLGHIHSTSIETRVIHIWHWLPLVTNTCLQLTKHKWARTRPSLTHTFQANHAHMFHTLSSGM